MARGLWLSPLMQGLPPPPTPLPADQILKTTSRSLFTTLRCDRTGDSCRRYPIVPGWTPPQPTAHYVCVMLLLCGSGGGMWGGGSEWRGLVAYCT